MISFDVDALPDMSGKVIIITGSSAGIGLEAARVLVQKCGAHVILACRNLAKAKPFEDELNAAGPGKATLLRIDTSDLSSVREFASQFLALNLDRLDCLVLNAGIMFGPYETVPTASSEFPNCEKQFATNNLGHYLLTQLLLTALTSTPGSKVVSTSSIAADQTGSMCYEVFNGTKPDAYGQLEAYSCTKLGNLLFTRELGKRLKAAGADTVAVPCHPGYASTELQTKSTPMWFQATNFFFRLLAGTAAGGAQPIVLAVCDAHPEDGVYYAPSGILQLSGVATSTAGKFQPLAINDEESAKFWAFCEELSGEKSSV